MRKGFIVICICLLLLTACTTNFETEEITMKISPSQARVWMQQYPDTIVLDVRTPTEFAAGHINGAILLPLDRLEAKAAEMLPSKDALILIYCRSGVRSNTAAVQLTDMGYTRVYDFGGILDWPYGKVYP
ncbi:MAG: rhodanese-like domain-containing protein [Defluviitaleaceae bacterium]|nr:rhodanese-like domain-containing protein [Defluviitaleaceae bacterium]MCL2240423.1 rhodanese-like domain-containing protein [Defluviitaleaceae bacterium]